MPHPLSAHKQKCSLNSKCRHIIIFVCLDENQLDGVQREKGVSQGRGGGAVRGGGWGRGVDRAGDGPDQDRQREPTDK